MDQSSVIVEVVLISGVTPSTIEIAGERAPLKRICPAFGLACVPMVTCEAVCGVVPVPAVGKVIGLVGLTELPVIVQPPDVLATATLLYPT
jgi:hypothetical protein